jgi:very-short-patch-repair endonuclease
MTEAAISSSMRTERCPRDKPDRAGNEMSGLEAVPSPGSLLAGAATRQNGLVTRSQLAGLGFSQTAIARRVANGTLHRLHQGVYVVGHEALAPLARETAALLACGPGAVISHLSAAVIWSLVPEGADGRDVHVTVTKRRVRSRPGLRVHGASDLTEVDVRRKGGVALTSPARTLLDLAGDRSRLLEPAFIEAYGSRLLRASELEALIRRAGGLRGVPALRGLMEAHASGYTRSEAERVMRKLARAAGLPEPRVNVQLHGYLVDFLWSSQRLVVEVDGYGFHSHRRAFETDRKRDGTLVAAGYRVIRVTWDQLRREPMRVVANVASALAHERAESSRRPG